MAESEPCAVYQLVDCVSDRLRCASTAGHASSREHASRLHVKSLRERTPSRLWLFPVIQSMCNDRIVEDRGAGVRRALPGVAGLAPVTLPNRRAIVSRSSFPHLRPPGDSRGHPEIRVATRKHRKPPGKTLALPSDWQRLDMQQLTGLSNTGAWVVAVFILATVLTTSVTAGSLNLRQRWLLALLAASAPVFCPSRGVASTFVTGMAIVIAARLADRKAFLARRRPSLGEFVLWHCVPVVRGIPGTADGRRKNRRAVLPLLARAGGKRLLWELIAWLSSAVPPESVPWPFKSALLAVYFVLNLTAMADLVLASCRAMGADTEELFAWPLLSTSVRDFWSRRWNKFINRFALKHIAIPLRGRADPIVVFVLVFTASGVFHEYFAAGVSGIQTVPGAMLLFFGIQIVAVFLGSRIPLPAAVPRSVRTGMTAVWMALTAPLFFLPLEPALLQLDYDVRWLPWFGPGPWDPFEATLRQWLPD